MAGNYTLTIIKPDAFGAAKAGNIVALLEARGFRVRAARVMHLTKQQAGEFCKFGYGEPLCVSADQKLGKDELFDAIFDKLPEDTGELAPAEAALKIAIVGRRNAGKSTFINSLAGAERVIVSEVPGTTRDSVDVRFERRVIAEP